MKVITDYLFCPSLKSHPRDTQSQLVGPTKQHLSSGLLQVQHSVLCCFTCSLPLTNAARSLLPGGFIVFPFNVGVQFMLLGLAVHFATSQSSLSQKTSEIPFIPENVLQPVTRLSLNFPLCAFFMWLCIIQYPSIFLPFCITCTIIYIEKCTPPVQFVVMSGHSFTQSFPSRNLSCRWSPLR